MQWIENIPCKAVFQVLESIRNHASDPFTSQKLSFVCPYHRRA